MITPAVRSGRTAQVAAPAENYAGAFPGGTASWLRPTLAVGAFLGAVLVAGYRTLKHLNVPGQPYADAWGLQDFRDAIYYPVVALLEGMNPYDARAYMAHYPVGNSFPLYSPLTLLLHLPFGLLPYRAGELAYFMVTAILVLALAYLTRQLCGLRITVTGLFGLGALILLSEPGHWNLYLGQSAASLAVGTYAALYFPRRRPWLAALGLAVATLKPTWGIPLALLMVAQGETGVVLRGLVIAGGLSLLPALFVLHSAGGLGPFLAVLHDNYTQFAADPAVDPLASAYRVDAVALFGRLLGRPLGTPAQIGLLLCILGGAAAGVARLRQMNDEAAKRLSAGIICLAMLIYAYHQTYELLLIAGPLVAAAQSRLGPAATAHRWLRTIAVCALCVPAFNYLVDGRTLSRVHFAGGWWLAVSSLNGLALLIGFGTYLLLAHRAAATARRTLA